MTPNPLAPAPTLAGLIQAETDRFVAEHPRSLALSRQAAGKAREAYQALVANPEGPAFQAALDLVFKGKEQPSGYTEPLLHAWRLKVKASG